MYGGCIFKNIYKRTAGCSYILTYIDNFFVNFILPNAKEIISEDQLKDAKSILQEKAQSKGYVSPQYKTTKETGPDHSKTFEVTVIINNKDINRII